MIDQWAPPEIGVPSAKQQFITFSLNNEEYAVNASMVREIIELTSVTRVPNLPDCIRGVINLRGAIIPVVDLKRNFGMATGEYCRHTCVIVTEFSGGPMGIIADAVSDVINIPVESMASAPGFGPRIKSDFISGFGRIGQRLVIVLDIDKVLKEEETAAVARAAETAADTHPK